MVSQLLGHLVRPTGGPRARAAATMRRNHVHRLIPKRATPPPGGFTARRARREESPRIPVQLPSPSRLKSISLSPLIDPQSPFSVPESDHQRLKWLNRFTPHWNESKKERRARFQLRAQKMRTRRAHVCGIFICIMSSCRG